MNPNLVHKHLLVRAEVNSPPLFKDRQKLDDEVRSLIQKIGMNILSGPHTEWSDTIGCVFLQGFQNKNHMGMVGTI